MRSPIKPVGHISRSGNGLERAAGSVHFNLHMEGAQRVFMCDAGKVYSIPSDMPTADAWRVRHANWFVGNYQVDAYRDSTRALQVRDEIAEDLRVRLRELRAMVA